MRVWAALLILVGCSAPPRPPIPAPRPPPVVVVERTLAPSKPAPAPPAFRLPRSFVPIRHQLDLSLDHLRLDGTMRITGDIVELAPMIWLHAIDLAVYRVTATREGKTFELAVAQQPESETIALVPEQPFAPGRWTIAIEYRAQVPDHGELEIGGPSGTDKMPSRGVFSQLHEGKRYTFTNFEPMDARRAFPCIDEPDRKVPWQLSLEVPAEMIAASNAEVVRTTPRGGRTRYEFAPTRPLPSYLVAFAVGPFEIVDAGTTRSGAPIRILAQHGDGANVRAAAVWPVPVFDAVQAWIEVPYAYGKIDLVSVPRTGPHWAAMENPGLITFEAVLLREPTTWVHVLKHEFAHQWFGNLVTLAWWDDIWINEGFATWLAAKIAIRNVPADPPPDPARYANYQPIPPASSIRPALFKIERRGALTGYFGGQPGARLVDQLERLIGESAFRDVIRDLLRKHAHGVATTADVVAGLGARFGHALDTTIGNRLDGVRSRQVTVKARCDGAPRLEIHQSSGDPAIVCVAVDLDGKRGDRCVTITANPTVIALGSKKCPRWVLADPRNAGLVDLRVDAAHVRIIFEHGWSQLEPLEQLALLRRASADAAGWGPADEALEIEIAIRLADSPDPRARDAAAHALDSHIGSIPADLRAAFDTWATQRFLETARQVGLRGGHLLDPVVGTGAVAVIAHVGDPILAKQAIDLLSDPHTLGSPMLLQVFRLALRNDRVRAAAYVEHARAGITPAMTAIGEAPFGIELLRGKTLSGAIQTSMLTARCDAKRRADVAALTLDATVQRAVLESLDRCLAHAKTLDPVFRRWLAPKRR